MSNIDSIFDSVFGNNIDVVRYVPKARYSTFARPANSNTTEAAGVEVTRNDIFHDEDKVDTTVPFKKYNRNRSGRAGRRTYFGRKAVDAVGGYSEDVKAIYAPAGAELCVIVDPRVGYNTDGTPNRNPAPKYNNVSKG